MSWETLSRLGVTVRPFAGARPVYGGTRSQFSAPFTSTIKLLARELDFLAGERIVLEAGFTEGQLRIDGLPKAGVRMDDPAIAVAFESKHGPLRYATAEFTSWQDNLRAIALAMEALRAVDRYGVSKRGEQYVGWRALPVSTDPADSLTSPAEARAWLEEKYDGDIRRAMRETHPDVGGASGEFRRVMKAKELLQL